MKKEKSRKTKNRGNGQGTVWKVKKGYRWQITLGYTSEGTRISRSGTKVTFAEANVALSSAKSDFARGLLGPPNEITVGQYAAQWLRRKHDVSPETLKKYGDDLAYPLEHIGGIKLQSIRVPLLKDLVSILAIRKMSHGRLMSQRTLLKIITQVRALFREAVGDQIIYANPMDGIKSPRGGRDVSKTADIKALNFEQEDRLIVVGTALYDAGMSRLWPALFLLVRMGLRRSEAMGLKWADIDFDKNLLYVRQTRIKAVIGTRTAVPKTKSAGRDLPMPADVIEMLKRHQSNQKAEKTVASGAWSEQGIVFATPLGNWTHPDNLNRSLATLVAWSDPQQSKQARWKGVDIDLRPALATAVQSGGVLPGVSPHDLRHTYATLTIRRGVPVEIVSRYLGHATVLTTLMIYRHVLPDELILAAIERQPLSERPSFAPVRVLN
ncbi:tyrosine-type recombinase/integrase [Deinococcus sp.]|uniref:tyrosine-type recombinase/integrase n=1 Tax=Deinococcus sp. TaxID=47478 RepID=UPI003CC58C8B